VIPSGPLDRIVVEATDPRAPDAQAALAQYFGELGARFRDGFDPDDAGAPGDAAALLPPDGAFVLLRAGGTTVGCGGLQRVDDMTAEIKRMWIHPDWRGRGLGRRLLAELEDRARTLGRARVVLDTNETLREAIAMYEGAGYAPIERYNDNPYAHHWFAKDLGPASTTPA
jgi:GNAT superfamily N-acetyltransferase